MQILDMDSHFMNCLTSMRPFSSLNQISGSKIMGTRTDVGSTGDNFKRKLKKKILFRISGNSKFLMCNILKSVHVIEYGH